MAESFPVLEALCVICGASFLSPQYPTRMGGPKKTCTRKCTSALNWRTKGVHDSPTKTCVVCGKLFTVPWKYRAATHCGNACRIKEMPRGAPITGRWKPCATCGTPIWVEPSLEYRKRFCSHSCRSLSTVRKYGLSDPTNIERNLYAALDLLGVTYQPQRRISHYIVDAWVPAYQTIIEADGQYWHSLPQRQARDAKLAAYATQQGYHLLRFDETDLLKTPVGALAERIKTLL